MTREELRNAISNACDIMRREGLTTMDYMEQLSWLLFLKSFAETENNLEAEVAYNGRTTTVSSPVTIPAPSPACSAGENGQPFCNRKRRE